MKTLIQLLHNFNNACLGNGIGTPPLYPNDLLSDWLREARTCGCAEPEAMKLSTHGLQGYPECRTVLFKGFHSEDAEYDDVSPYPTYLTFYSNYDSNKGLEIGADNRVALTFYWPELYREVRITGNAVKHSRAASSDYWQGRKWKSRVASFISQQSRPIENRKTLVSYFKEALADIRGSYIPRPECWGGYLIYPIKYEFFQGRQNRLNERLKYTFDPHDGKVWHTQILQP